jgi:hypothetical protein
MFYYQAFGLTFLSDREIPDLDRARESPVVDYSLRFDNESNQLETLRREFNNPFYIGSSRVKSGRTVIEAYRTENYGKFLFRFYDGIEFIVDQGTKNIFIDGLRRAPLQAASNHLLFALPGFLLGLRKSTCLHGAAIGWGDGAIALLGRSNSGKSMLSAHMAAQGLEILSDDLVALDVGNKIKVYSGYPWIGLRASVLHSVRAGTFEADRVGPKWHYLDEAYVTWDLRKPGSTAQSESRRLKAIYFLNPVEDPHCAPAIERVPQHQAVMALMEAANRTHIPYPEFRAQEFSLMCSVVGSVSTYQLQYHLCVDCLPTLSDLLVHRSGLGPRRREKIEA